MAEIGMYMGGLAVLLVVLFAGLNHGVEGMVLSSEELEIERYLNKMNKPAVKTIESPTGELIDCVDIYKQPSLDHPLLRNHTIQMEFIFDPTDINEQQASIQVHQPWHVNGKCPKGTIPILRIQKSDILRAGSLENFQMKIYKRRENSFCTALKNVNAFGVRADVNNWNPNVEPSDSSGAQMSISTSKNGYVTFVETGLVDDPPLFGDNKTRFFIYWGSRVPSIGGCLNLRCKGFIQTNSEIALGAPVSPYSIYGGEQYQLPLEIVKDRKRNGNWWLKANGKDMGYWPKELIPGLQDGSQLVEWRGAVYNHNYLQGATFTQMGSGHFAGEGFRKAAYFDNIGYFDLFGNFEEAGSVAIIVDDPYCYDMRFVGTHTLYYGGPGKNPNCL